MIDPPDGMTSAARDVWDRLAPETPHLEPLHAPMFAQLCEAIAVTERLRPALEKPVVQQPNGRIIPSPAFTAWREASATALRLAEAMGITPSSQRRNGLMPDQTPEPVPQTRRLYAVE